MAEATCSIEGCDRPHAARGWCKIHYYRWKRQGDPLIVIPKGTPGVGGRPRIHPIRFAECGNCGKTFQVPPGSHGKFCDRACFIRAVKKTCPQCGKKFQIKESKAAKYRYCSLACRQIATLAARVTYLCETCGNEISRLPNQPPARWCSHACHSLGAQVSATCARCHRPYTVPRWKTYKGTRRCCSNRCATLLRMAEGFEPGYLATKRRTGYRTDIEALAEVVLQELGITYEFEKKIGRYSVDFALPDLSVALECDGWHHVMTTDRDAKRDAYLATKGWTVVRVGDTELRSDARTSITAALRAYGV